MALVTGCINYWKLDESSGNAADSVASLTLTNNNTVTYVPGKINNGAERTTSNQYLYNTTPPIDYAGMATGWSISFWAYFNTVPPTGDGDRRCFAYMRATNGSNLRDMRIYYDGRTATQGWSFQMFNAGAAVTGLGTVSGSTWYYVTLTYDGTNARFYINGSLVNTTARTYSTQAGTSVPGIYMFQEGTYNFGPLAIIDEVGVWSRALSGSEITELYNSGAGLSYPFTPTFTASPMIHHMAISGGLM